MEKATISQLKDRLSAYLKEVRSGRTILVFDRNQPIARIGRIEPGALTDDRVGRLESAGRVRRARLRVNVASLRREPPDASASVLAALLQDRREGR